MDLIGLQILVGGLLVVNSLIYGRLCVSFVENLNVFYYGVSSFVNGVLFSVNQFIVRLQIQFNQYNCNQLWLMMWVVELVCYMFSYVLEFDIEDVCIDEQLVLLLLLFIWYNSDDDEFVLQYFDYVEFEEFSKVFSYQIVVKILVWLLVYNVFLDYEMVMSVLSIF